MSRVADGNKVVFENFTGEGEEEFNQDIWVMNADGSGVEQITSGRAYDHSASFFPSRGAPFPSGPFASTG